MGFHEAYQQQHKIDGIKKALASSKTPSHLRPHLEKRLKEHTMGKPKQVMNDNDGDELVAAKPNILRSGGLKYPGGGKGSTVSAKPKKNPQGKSKAAKKNMLFGY